jgi:hypothetical protein
MLQFSFWQRILLGFGLVLIVLSLSLKHVTEIWSAFFQDDSTIYWNNIAVSPGRNERISKLDETTLVIRSAIRPHARLTLFTRDDDGAQPVDLVKDLCGRDSCVYFPLENAQRNGAVADYRSDTPLRIVLMHPAEQGVWLEYKGSPGAYESFSGLIDAIVTQIRDKAAPEEAT